MIDWHLFGWLGLLLIHGSRLPQIYFMLKQKRASGLSLSGTAAVQAGLASYLVYALAQHDPVFIASNIIGLALQGVVLVLNFTWREQGSIVDSSGFYLRQDAPHAYSLQHIDPPLFSSISLRPNERLRWIPAGGSDDPLNQGGYFIVEQVERDRLNEAIEAWHG